jgi:hypothetical protein
MIVRMMNYSLLFPYPYDNHFKAAEVFPYRYYYLNLGAMFYYTELEAGEYL